MKPSSRSGITVGLLWHSLGHANLGIDALARGHILVLARAAKRAELEPHFLLMGGSGRGIGVIDASVEVGPAPAIKRLLRFDTAFAKALKRCDIVFDIGEGDSFTDIYGGRRFISQLGSKVVALALARPLVLAPQTIGPFQSLWRRRLAVLAMRRMAAIYSRDKETTQSVQEAGISDVREIIDVAFALPFTKPPSGQDGRPLKVGLNVSGLLYFSPKERFGLSMDYAEFCRLLVSRLREQGREVHLIAHVAGDGGVDDDAPAIRDLAKDCAGVLIAPGFGSSVDAKSYIAGMDFFVGGRMHACIAAFSAGVPVVPVAYSRKFSGLFNTLGYHTLLDARVTDAAAGVDYVLGALERRPQLKETLLSGQTFAAQRLYTYEEELIGILRRVAKPAGTPTHGH